MISMDSIDPNTVPPDVLRLANTLPRFSDGRIDYTHADEAPVLNVFVTCRGKLLLVHRGDKVGWLKDHWHIVAGFLDEEKTLAEKALEEVYEETGIVKEQVVRVSAFAPILGTGSKQWIIHPVIIELSEFPHIVLDWENIAYAWVGKDELDRYDLLPEVLRFAKTL